MFHKYGRYLKLLSCRRKKSVGDHKAGDESIEDFCRGAKKYIADGTMLKKVMTISNRATGEETHPS